MVKCIKCGMEYHPQREGAIRVMQGGTWVHYGNARCFYEDVLVNSVRDLKRRGCHPETIVRRVNLFRGGND